MSQEINFLLEEDAEGGFCAKAPGHSIFIQADTIDEIKLMIKDAVNCHFEPADLPKMIRLHFVKNNEYNLALTDFTEDFIEYSINNVSDWNVEESGWDNVLTMKHNPKNVFKDLYLILKGRTKILRIKHAVPTGLKI